jgi:enoyl-CoA hydratase/carnithine racemase
VAKKRARAKAPAKRPTLPEGLRYDQDGRVGTVTLARPERLNALTFETYAGLRDLFAWLKTQREPRVIILTGEGRGFCSGGDVEDIIGKLLAMDRRQLGEFTKMTCDTVARMRECPQPIIGALNGVVAGAGAALALACDVRIAAPEAKISFLFVKAGLSSADMGASHLLPRLIGLGRASEYLLTGDFIDAINAQKWGLYNEVVPGHELMAEARLLAERIARGPAKGIPASKWAIEAELSMPLAAALKYDAKLQADLALHPDFREAYNAFKEKRPAKFA